MRPANYHDRRVVELEKLIAAAEESGESAEKERSILKLKEAQSRVLEDDIEYYLGR